MTPANSKVNESAYLMTVSKPKEYIRHPLNIWVPRQVFTAKEVTKCVCKHSVLKNQLLKKKEPTTKSKQAKNGVG